MNNSELIFNYDTRRYNTPDTFFANNYESIITWIETGIVILYMQTSNNIKLPLSVHEKPKRNNTNKHMDGKLKNNLDDPFRVRRRIIGGVSMIYDPKIGDEYISEVEYMKKDNKSINNAIKK